MDEHTLNDLLECSVCLERLDISSKVLPCQHTFCRKCLEVIVCSHQELRCPECRVLVDVKIDDLPPNVLLMRILEGMKNAAATKTQQQQQQLETMQQIETSRLNNSNTKEQLQQQQKQKANEQMQKQLLQYQQQLLQQKKITIQQQQQHSNTQTSLPNGQNENLYQQHQPRRSLLPHAYAMHDFESSESADLNFKKGDLLLLKRKIDDNWYVGQANGVEGTFPINYVKVIVPLPTPQCIALYDFKMGPNEEEGCLSFKKGAIIHVLRRVDQNWAEGRLAGAIGIFPIAFVRLNALAEQMLDINQRQLPQPIAITTPPTTNSTTTQTMNIPPPTTNTNTSSSNNRNKSNSTNNSNDSIPSASQENTLQHGTVNVRNDDLSMMGTSSTDYVQLRYREGREKRHSLNALLNDTTSNNVVGATAASSASALSIAVPSEIPSNMSRHMLSSNRHSAEILSLPHDTNINPQPQQQTTQSCTAMPQTTIAHEQQQQQQPPEQQTPVNVLKSPVVVQQQMIPPTLPWGYLALYPYKPRKTDELELKKGCVYIVTERCLDGWFKGKNWQDTLGVFPGNYVTPLRPRDQKQLMHQWKHVPLVSMAPLSNITTTLSTATTMPSGSGTTTASRTHLPILQIPPPDAPPRQEINVSPCSSPAASTTTCASVWTKPLGHTVEAFFNRNSNINNNNNTNNNNYNSYNKNNSNSNSNKTNEKTKEKENNCITASTTTTTGTTTMATATCTSTNAAVSLMKRLTSMKSRSKSPSASASLQEETNNMTQLRNAQHQQQQQQQSHMQVVHVRSGSCPSQLLQNMSKQQQHASNEHLLYTQHEQQQQQQTITNISYGSQRLKGCKERSTIPNSRQSLDANIFRNAYQHHQITAQQQQQQQQQQQHVYSSQNNGQTLQIINHRKSQSLDANTIIAANAMSNMPHPLPPSIPSVMTMSATSANMKNTQIVRERRFRCIVPYPPNSEFELELHIGDIIYVQRKPKNGWFKGTCARTNKTGLFPASFVEPDI